MNDQKPNTGVTGAIQTIDQGDSIKEIREALARARKHLKSMPDGSDPVECARIAGCSRAPDRPGAGGLAGGHLPGESAEYGYIVE